MASNSNSNEVHVDINPIYHPTSQTTHRRTPSGNISTSIGSSSSSSSSSSNNNNSNNPKSRPKFSVRELIMFYRRRVFKLIILLAITLSFAGVYVGYFRHPPPDVLLMMNSKSVGGQGSNSAFGAMSFQVKGDDDCEDGDDDCDEKDKQINIRDPSEVEGTEYWQAFLKRNNFVAIGAVYDKCDNWRSQYGTVVLLKDKELGGVKARTYANFTVDQEITTGQFSIEVKYNGQDLYDNYWDVCEVEDELPVANRTFVCPIKTGKHMKQMNRHVPAYLPTGHYQTKAWVTDELENILACAYAEFKL